MTHPERAARRQKIAEYCREHTQIEAALEYGVSIHTVKAACLTGGVKYRCDNAIASSTYDVIADLVNTDAALPVVGVKHRISRQRIHQIFTRCLKAGIPVRPRARSRPDCPDE